MNTFATITKCRFPHGVRARYVNGCRCAECRAANTAYQRELTARKRAQLEAAPAPAREGGVVRSWRPPGHGARLRRYRTACPGTGPLGCPHRSILRKDAWGGLCGRCGAQATWAGRVPAAPVRAHLLALRKLGVGYKATAAASGVAASALVKVLSGVSRQVQAETARRVLAVDEGARAGGARVPAGPTWKRVRALQRLGWSKAAIAAELGCKMPALQLGSWRVTAAHERAVRELLERAIAARAGAARPAMCARCRTSHADDPAAEAWCREHADVPLTPRERQRVRPAERVA